MRYLLLSVNDSQELFELEFVPFDPEDALLSALRSGGRLDREEIKEQLATFHRRYNHLLELQSARYNLRHEDVQGFIVISVASCSDHYIRTHRNDVSVITLGDWKRWMAPPSILEFIYVISIRAAVQICGFGVRNHLGTKGCIFDFGGDLSDVRQMVLAGRICRRCKDQLAAKGAAEHIAGLERALSREWLKDRSDPQSPASIVAKLGHDLFAVKDLKVSPSEQVKGVLAQEGVKQALAIAGSVVAAALILAFGLRANEARPAPASTPVILPSSTR